MSQYVYGVTDLRLTENTYKNSAVTSVDCKNVPFVGNSAYNAFYNCRSLTTVSNINQSLTNMSHTFFKCYALSTIPAIPNSVTKLSYTFWNCENLTTTPTIPSGVTNMAGTFIACRNITTPPTIPNSVTDISYVLWFCNKITAALNYNLPNCTNAANAFDHCESVKDIYLNIKNATDVGGIFYVDTNLVNAYVDISNATDLSEAFDSCINLVNLTLKISNKITNLSETFSQCYNLTTQPMPTIPNTVVNMHKTFYYTYRIHSYPNIPASVTDMSETFSDCYNFTGNIYISSYNVSNAYNCFAFTGNARKDIYLPFKYENGVASQTYNSFIAAGYTTTGTLNGIYLKDYTPQEDLPIDQGSWQYTKSGSNIILENYTSMNASVKILK